jgi:hypothetical protein
VSRKKTGTDPGVKFEIYKSQNWNSLGVIDGSKFKYQFSEAGLGHGKEGRSFIFLNNFFQDPICLFRLVINSVNTF